MKANQANLLQFMRKLGHMEVPVYQRAYSWSKDQCRQLWEDITSLARNEQIKSHFMGVVVYVEKDVAQISSVNTCFLIDGQQRLTTISLLLAALSSTIEGKNQKNDVLIRKIRNHFLINSEENGALKYKLGLNSDDAVTYTSIIENKDSLPRNYSKNISENYGFFKELIEQSSLSATQIFNSLLKLVIIDVALEKDSDNPQLIFDSLNSTGLRLSNSDQIRNFVLMGLAKAEQEDLYRNYWIHMEQMFADVKEPFVFERFLRDYLTIQNNGEVPAVDQMYFAFNSFFTEKLRFQPRKEIIKHIYKYAGYFIDLTYANIEDPEIQESVRDINTLGAKDAYPFLMEVFDDFENGLISKEILVEILKNVENYVLKRAINANDDETQNITFATLSRDINAMLNTKNFSPKEQKKSPKKIADLMPVSVG